MELDHTSPHSNDRMKVICTIKLDKLGANGVGIETKYFLFCTCINKDFNDFTDSGRSETTAVLGFMTKNGQMH